MSEPARQSTVALSSRMSLQTRVSLALAAVAIAAGVVYCISSSRLCAGSNILNYSRLMYFNVIFTFGFISLHDDSI